jgi:hypothetical protein
MAERPGQPARQTAAPQASAATLGRSVESGLRHALGAPDAPLPKSGQVDISRLRLHLPPGAGPDEIAEAVNRAVLRELGRRRS